ncbi:MAG: BolA family transcriptional regulator [Bauldia sp.]|nr:BolA family transcriptional regulator [Bauldia sp.]
MGAVRDSITRTLTEAFQPASLEVVDESHLHKGHAGWSEGGETHFRVRITAPAFAGMTRVAIHRAINDALKAELAGDVHALAIEAKAA